MAGSPKSNLSPSPPFRHGAENPTLNKNMKELNRLELMDINGGTIPLFEVWAAVQLALGEQNAADLWAEWTRIYGQYQQ